MLLMRFKQYINEDYVGTLIEDTIKVLERDCGPFIKD
jgi:hypothetical protein